MKLIRRFSPSAARQDDTGLGSRGSSASPLRSRGATMVLQAAPPSLTLASGAVAKIQVPPLPIASTSAANGMLGSTAPGAGYWPPRLNRTSSSPALGQAELATVGGHVASPAAGPMPVQFTISSRPFT